jgi:type II secretory pathway pseudopilin PulG
VTTARSRRLLAVAIVAVLGAGIVVSLSLSSTTARKDLSAHAVVQRYYADLRSNDARAAFHLLCVDQQVIGTAAFERNAATVVAVRSWRQGGADLTDRLGHRAVVGVVALADGFSTPIEVIVTHGAGGWSVCGTNFGGVLPYPKGTKPPATTSI